MKSMVRNFFCNHLLSFVMLLAIVFLLFSAHIAIAQTVDNSEQLLAAKQLLSMKQLQSGEQLQTDDQRQKDGNVVVSPQVSTPSRAEKFFSVPAPELGATFRGSSLIDMSVPTTGQAAGEQFIMPDVSRALKQFGYDFFANPKGSFIPDKMAPVGPDYMVGPGDRLLVSIWGSIEGNHEAVVGRSG